MKYLIALLFALLSIVQASAQDATAILNKVDDNINSHTSILKSDMIIYGRRNQRTVTSVGYTEGKNKSFSEYLAPAREKGTKMLKLEDNLWIYSPSTDRTIQLSGHMLKQSLMGSDLSYEDMMENRKLTEMYDAKVIGEETIDDRKTWVLQLNAKVDDASYDSRKIWVDTERYVPLQYLPPSRARCRLNQKWRVEISWRKFTKAFAETADPNAKNPYSTRGRCWSKVFGSWSIILSIFSLAVYFSFGLIKQVLWK